MRSFGKWAMSFLGGALKMGFPFGFALSQHGTNMISREPHTPLFPCASLMVLSDLGGHADCGLVGYVCKGASEGQWLLYR